MWRFWIGCAILTALTIGAQQVAEYAAPEGAHARNAHR